MEIKELLEKQKELDTYITKEKNLGNPYDKKYIPSRKLALLVEIGELANATRCFKYWSNKGPESKERQLDELADCIHFAASLANFDTYCENDEHLCCTDEVFRRYNEFDGECDLIESFNAMYEILADEDYDYIDYLLGIIALGCMLDFTAEEIEQAYLKKHEINYQRQQEGY